MDKYPHMNFVGYEKHPYYGEFYEDESESESEDEDDEQTIQYRKEMEEGCPEGYTTIWNSYGFSYEKMEEQEQCVYDVNGKPIQTIKDFKKEFGELVEQPKKCGYEYPGWEWEEGIPWK